MANQDDEEVDEEMYHEELRYTQRAIARQIDSRERLVAAENYVARERTHMERAVQTLRDCREFRIEWSHEVENVKVLLETHPDWSGKIIVDLKVKNERFAREVRDEVREIVRGKEIQVEIKRP